MFFWKWSYLSSFLTENGVSFKTLWVCWLTNQVLSAIGHLSGLALYTVLSSLEPLLVAALDVEGQSPAERFRWHRRFEAWRYGSGLDYESHEKWAVSCAFSPFWKAWRLLVISVVSPSPCDSLDRRFRTFSAAPEGATKPFFKPQNGIDILENHESAPRLPLLSIVHDCTDVWWKEACTASYFWTFISLTCSAQACWLYGWLVSSFVSAPTWYSFVWTLAILI